MGKHDVITKCPRAKKIVDRLRKIGWSMSTSGKHRRLFSPDGKTAITVLSTPSDYRASQNWISQLRRDAGVPRSVLENV